MRWGLAVTAALLVVLAVLVLGLFIVQNSAHTVELSLELPYPPLRWSFVHPSTGEPLPALLLMGLSFLGGFGVGAVLLAWQAVRHGRRTRKLQQELALRPTVPVTRPSTSAPPVKPRREEPVTNVATPLRTTANRPPRTDEIAPEPTAVGGGDPDPDTQTRNW